SRLKPVLLNITLRLRAAYLERAATPERLAVLIAEFAAPLRTCAATLLELEGQPLAPPREALQTLLCYTQTAGHRRYPHEHADAGTIPGSDLCRRGSSRPISSGPLRRGQARGLVGRTKPPWKR